MLFYHNMPLFASPNMKDRSGRPGNLIKNHQATESAAISQPYLMPEIRGANQTVPDNSSPHQPQ